MKVVVIGQMNGWYGSISEWVGNAWEYNLHDVTRVDRKNMASIPKKADIYFFVDCSEDYSQDIPSDIEGVKAAYLMDIQMPGGVERSVNIARKMDYNFCTNKEYGVDILAKFGIDSIWVTYGYDHILAKEVYGVNQSYMDRWGNYDYKYDVFMVGHPNSQERVKLWDILRERYKERAFVGTVQDRSEYVAAKGAANIMIGQPTEPWRNIINLRVFNALACRKLLLMRRPVDIKEYEVLGFKDGFNIVYWDEFRDLIEKIDYYLEHPRETENIRLNAMGIGYKYLMPNQIRIIEQVLLSKFYERLSK